ncbi:enoyl-CoA hydratase family protein [Sphingomicrobium clamense]|uniref:Enoyl-CoA hydratase family protein n=1 Tax=Sphingomicrobium clamense TaxID=2851013 RepID=A0ABS6V8F0_9SPHN|nr:enoyl-CoA hydratase family protein [Sphingomicrobium sp. B8]
MSLHPPHFKPDHFRWAYDGDTGVATITLDRPEKKNPLTFDSYAELRDTFRDLVVTPDVRAIVITGSGGNFCSGGDVFEIIEPLTKMAMPELLAFTRMTGDLVRAMRACPQPIVAAVEGVAAGAGAILAMASDLRVAAPDAKTAFLFTRVGLAGADMGACAVLPRLIGHGRAADLLYTGRSMGAEEGRDWGFYQRLSDDPLAEATELATDIATGPAFAHAMTKRQLDMEFAVPIDTALEMEAQAQAICMQTNDFTRAFEAFANKRKPEFKGD